MQKALLANIADKGARLREVRKELLRQRPGESQRWFQGPDGNDLFLWYDGRQELVHIQLTVERRVLEWSPAEGLRTGRLIAFNPVWPFNDQGKIEFDPRPNDDTIELARVFLGAARVDEITLMLVRKQLGLFKNLTQ